jgi:hypothetical protein
VLLDLAAVTVEDSVVLDPVEVEGEGLGGLDSDAIYGDTKIPVDVGLATAAGDQPAIPLEGRLDHHGRTPVDRDFRCLNLRAAADHRGELRVRRESVSDPMPDPVGRGARRQDQIDVHRDGGGSGNDGRLRLSEERLCRCGKRRPLDPHEFLPGAIENSDARQRHRLREHADDEKLVFDMVHAIVAANNLGLVYRTDQNRSRPAGLCGRNGRGESEDGHYEIGCASRRHVSATDGKAAVLAAAKTTGEESRHECLRHQGTTGSSDHPEIESGKHFLRSHSMGDPDYEQI